MMNVKGKEPESQLNKHNRAIQGKLIKLYHVSKTTSSGRESVKRKSLSLSSSGQRETTHEVLPRCAVMLMRRAAQSIRGSEDRG